MSYSLSGNTKPGSRDLDDRVPRGMSSCRSIRQPSRNRISFQARFCKVLNDSEFKIIVPVKGLECSCFVLFCFQVNTEVKYTLLNSLAEGRMSSHLENLSCNRTPSLRAHSALALDPLMGSVVPEVM